MAISAARWKTTSTPLKAARMPCGSRTSPVITSTASRVGRRDRVEPAPGAEGVVEGQSAHARARVEESLGEVAADEAIGAGHQRALASQIHLAPSLDRVARRAGVSASRAACAREVLYEGTDDLSKPRGPALVARSGRACAAESHDRQEMRLTDGKRRVYSSNPQGSPLLSLSGMKTKGVRALDTARKSA